MKLAGKVAVVSGASKGIGKAIALELARQGATVVVLGNTDLAGAEEVADLIRASGGEAIARKVDVTNFQEVQDMVDQTIAEFGRIDILVNNAGITRDNILLKMKESEWDEVLGVNLKGVFHCTKAVARLMFRQRSGKIINISSIVGILGNPGQANYAAAKAGIIGFTKSMARELAGFGITVNAVAPGYIETQMTEKLPEQARQALMGMIPLKRPGQPEDVAKAVAFLASGDADYITSHVLNVDGGMAM